MQQINLYHNKLRKKVLVFSFQRLTQGAVALLLILACIHALNEYSYYSTQSQLGQHAKILLARTQQLNTLQASLPKVQSDASLKTTFQKLEKELSNKQLVLDILSNKKLGNSEGFVQHFAGLARQTIQGLWITRAHLRHGGTEVDLQGKSTHANLVPKYLQALSSENAFKGTEFNSFIIENNSNNNIVEFKLNNISSDKPKLAAANK